jgi:deoxyribodipyrimidine photolyase-like uncharacterized protein
MRHESSMGKNPRMVMQVRNLKRMSEEAKQAINAQAKEHRKTLISK